MRKIIDNLTHHLDDYECMWNGIEDLYINKTKESIPDQFFFAMSGFCGFAYIKTNKNDVKRMVSFGDGRTKKMYEFLAPIVNFKYHHVECGTPILALNKAKKEIDSGYPVILGALDMYYLEYYPKLYHNEHIPFHYIMMVGYDDENKVIYIYDCGRKERLTLSYENLLLAFNASYPGLCKPNTICTIRMDNPNSKKDIAKKALSIKADAFLNPPVSFLGIDGIKKLASEMIKWNDELGKEEVDKILRNIVEFSGSVPTIPNRLKGINEKDSVTFMCSRDKMSRVLKSLSEDFNCDGFVKASEIFLESGKLFEKLCYKAIDYILGINLDLLEMSKIILNIGLLEYDAFEIIRKNVEDK